MTAEHLLRITETNAHGLMATCTCLEWYGVVHMITATQTKPGAQKKYHRREAEDACREEYKQHLEELAACKKAET